MREYFLKVIAEQKGRPMGLALASLAGAGIYYRVRVSAPNVFLVEYRVEGYFDCQDIKGTLVF
jgi:hypothetical protein